jgi:CheY-like chemotaxis protein
MATARPTSAGCILVVEDNSASATILRVNLERHGYRVLLADNGTKALALLDTTHDIDLMITDISMPGMDGIELLQELRKRPEWSTLPVIVESGVADTEMVRAVAKLGVKHFIVKPINGPQVVQTVDELVSHDAPVLLDRAVVMRTLQLDAKTYEELLAGFLHQAATEAQALEQALAGGLTEVSADMVASFGRLGESALTLGARRLSESIDAFVKAAPEESTAGGRRVGHEIKRLCGVLACEPPAPPPPAPPDVAVEAAAPAAKA